MYIYIYSYTLLTWSFKNISVSLQQIVLANDVTFFFNISQPFHGPCLPYPPHEVDGWMHVGGQRRWSFVVFLSFTEALKLNTGKPHEQSLEKV